MSWLLQGRHDERVPLAVATLVVTAVLGFGCWDLWQRLQDTQLETVTSTTAATPVEHSGETAGSTVAPEPNTPPQDPGAGKQAPAAHNAYFSVSADEPAKPAGPGLWIAPSYSPAGKFEGYLVQGRSGDYRFNHGDIITAVNQTPVEDSAAGSELLLIALAQPNTPLTTRKQP